ncbi:MAG: glycosyltransferase family 1 protein, partial [Nitrospiraceae bacterium]
LLRDDELRVFHELTEKERMDFEAAVTWKATLLYRLGLVKALERFDTVIHGDAGWRTVLDNSRIRIGPPLHYYKELPLFYNACAINFNATSRQMPETVNQRVFDVPACGAFILTDHREVLKELFHVGREIITYRHRDEVPEIAKFFLRYPWERERVALRGRERVLKEHTYRHRLRSLIYAMEQRYKS